jgi:hypothetical protein
MGKNLQSMNEIFNEAYQQYEEEPSAATWEKINALLDKQDADRYKKGFIGWKRIAILLLFLLSGLIIYESRIIIKGKRGNGLAKKANKKDSVSDRVKKTTSAAATDHQKQLPLHQSNATKHESVYVQTSIQQQRKLVVLKRKMNIPGREGDLGFSVNNKLKRSGAVNESVLNETSINETQARKRLMMASAEIITNPEIFSMSKFNPKIRMNLFLDSQMARTTFAIMNKKSLNYFKPYWSVTAFASNDWGQYQLYNDVQDNNGNNQDEKEEINRREKHESSFSTGLLATRLLTKKWGIKTGFIYSNISILIDPEKMFASQKPDGKIAYKYITSSGYGYVKPGFGLAPVIGDSIQSTKAQHNLQTLSVPLMLTYTVKINKISLMPSAGIMANYITNATVQTEVIDALNREAVTINGLYGMRNFYVGLMTDINMQYNYDSKWSFNFLPTFKYALTSITKSNVVKTHPYSFGFGAGITYKF